MGLSLADVKISYLIRRLALFLPMLLAFGLTVPMTQFDKGAAWSWMISLWLRCTVSFLAGLWLIHALPFPALMTTLLRLALSKSAYWWPCWRSLYLPLHFHLVELAHDYVTLGGLAILAVVPSR